MASSGSFNTSGYEGRYLKFSWNVQSQSIANNTTKIAWRLEGAGSASSSYYKAGNFRVVLDGSTVYSTGQNDRINLYNGTLVASGTYTFTHNSSGTKTFSASVQAGIYTYAVNCSGSGSFTLPTINRVSTINTISGNKVSDNFIVNYTEYSNSFTNNLIITINGTTTTQTITNYQSGASFTLSTSFKNAIYNSVTTNKTVTLLFSLATYNGSTLIGNSSNTTVSVTIDNSNPTIGSLTYADVNSTTTTITNNNQYIIRNNSSLKVTLTNLNAVNGATLDSITLSIAGITETIELSGTNIASQVTTIGAINLASNGTLTATLTDSRGNSATLTTTILVYDWVAPTAVISCAREDNYYTSTNLLVKSNYSSLGGNNTITITAYTKLESASTYGSAISVTDNVTSVLTLDNASAWNIKVVVADKLSSTTYILNISRGMPIVYFDRLNKSVGINCFPQQEESLEVSGLRLDDKIYIGSQSIYDYYETSTAGESVLICAYDYQLIESLFSAIDVPTNYERAYRITFQYTTLNSNIVVVRLNNISSYNCNTWSASKFRRIGGTRIFKESELTLETADGYSRNGLNLYVSNSTAYTAKLWNITVHGYLVNTSTNLNISAYNIPDETPTQID